LRPGRELRLTTFSASFALAGEGSRFAHCPTAAQHGRRVVERASPRCARSSRGCPGGSRRADRRAPGRRGRRTRPIPGTGRGASRARRTSCSTGSTRQRTRSGWSPPGAAGAARVQSCPELGCVVFGAEFANASWRRSSPEVSRTPLVSRVRRRIYASVPERPCPPCSTRSPPSST
jgi:hypothetical protein